MALPYEDQGEYLVTLSCLTVQEIHSLRSGAPTYPFCLHYQQGYKVPPIRNWIPSEVAADLVSRWERKDRLPAPEARREVLRWGELATKGRDFAEEDGHGIDSRLVSLDNIPGPCSLSLRPGEQEIQHSELKHYTKTAPVVQDPQRFAKSETTLKVGPQTGGAATEDRWRSGGWSDSNRVERFYAAVGTGVRVTAPVRKS